MKGICPLIKSELGFKTGPIVLDIKKKMLWFFLPTFIKLYTVFTFPTVTYNTVDQISFGIEYCDRQNNGHVKMSTFSAPGAVDGDHTWPRGFHRSDGGSREGERESPQQPVGTRWGCDAP